MTVYILPKDSHIYSCQQQGTGYHKLNDDFLNNNKDSHNKKVIACCATVSKKYNDINLQLEE